MTHRDDPAPESPLPIRLRWRVFGWTLALQASWNLPRMQNLGLLGALAPWLRRADLPLEERRRICRRHFGFFNTNPYLASIVVGGLLRLEADAARGVGVAPSTIHGFRDTLARVCGSLGDQLFWLGLRPALALATCLLAMLGHGLAALALVVLFAVVQLVLRGHWLGRASALGLDVSRLMAARGWHRAIAWSQRTALALTGLLGGLYFAVVLDRDPTPAGGELAAGLLLALGAPLVLRQRIPGEGQAIVCMVLAAGVASLI